MIAHPRGFLGGLQRAAPQQREACASIALALEPLQTGDLAFHGAIALGQGEPGFDGRKVLLQALGEAAERLNPAVGRCGHPRVKRVAPALPHECQKGLAQLIRLGNRGVCLGQLVHIRLGVW